MNRFLENLKREAEENPVLALGIAAGLITAISQLMNASANKRNSASWQREVDRRTRNIR
jgi:hypothetical protein